MFQYLLRSVQSFDIFSDLKNIAFSSHAQLKCEYIFHTLVSDQNWQGETELYNRGWHP